MSRRIYAYHGAGHVVAALVLEIPFDKSIITDTSDDMTFQDDDPLTARGITVGLTRVLSAADINFLFRFMIYRLSGLWAETLVSSSSRSEGSRLDVMLAESAVQVLTDQCVSSAVLLGHAARCAKELVTESSEMVHAIAARLLETDTLTESGAKALCSFSDLRTVRVVVAMEQPDRFRSVEDQATIDAFIQANPNWPFPSDS